MTNRYDTSHLIEDQFEPGSNSMVLRNLLGITDLEKMEIYETAELWLVQEESIREITPDKMYTAEDIRQLHRRWLGTIYPWAGEYRQVNMSKGGFPFSMAHVIPGLMDEFEKNQLRKYTPCRFDSNDDVAHALAEVHVELMLIHPFREGNGRLGRLFAMLMAFQSGLPPLLDFSDITGVRKEEYFRAIRIGLDRNYQPMKALFSEIIERSVWLWGEI